MFLTTLCYIEKDDCYLMLHRVKKENDLNHDKWIGVGGKFEAEEMPEECMLREVKEETGLTLTSYRARASLPLFLTSGAPNICIYLRQTSYREITDCDEGELVWVPKKEIKDLKLWEGDKIFLRLLDECEEYFSLKLVYEGDTLVDKKLIIAGKEQKAE